MKDLFDRHEDKLTESEDRRVWAAMRGAAETTTPWWRRAWVPPAAAAGVVAVLAVAVLGPDVMRRGGTDYLAGQAEEKSAAAPHDLAQAPASETAPDAARVDAAGRAEDRNSAPAEAYDEASLPPGKPEARSQLASTPADRRDAVQVAAPAPGVIRGRVVDPEGNPLRFAFVTVTGSEASALTDENGEFELTGVPAGERVLNVEYAGLDPFALPVIVEDAPLLAQIAMTELNAQGVFALNEEGDDRANRDKKDQDAARREAAAADELIAPLVPPPSPEGPAEPKPATPGKEQAEAEAIRQGVTGDLQKLPVDKSEDKGALNYQGGRSGEVQYQVDGIPVNDPLVVGGSAALENAIPAEGPPSGKRPPISVGGTDPVNDEAYDAMFFKNYGVNPFVDAEEDNLATFAVDVDNASYTLARAYLTAGNLPPRDAVRVEEFINAFEHRYPAPGSEFTASRAPVPSEHGTFAIYLDAAPSPFGKDLTLLRVGLKGREIDDEHRKPANLTFVIDVSGSMDREDRLGLVKQSLFLLLDRMRREDRVGIVVYGTTARMVLPHTALDRRRDIERAIEGLVAEGATNAEDGLRQGYALADRAFREGWINRVILCSDGVANVGQTGPQSILAEIKREARRGIYMTAVGFGMGNYNDVLMEQLADQGDGHYFYVDELREAERVFVTDLNGTLQTIAREVKVQVEFAPDAVDRYRLLGYENRDVADVDFRNDRVDAGEVGAGHEVTALFEMKLDGKRRGPVATVRIRYEDPETGKVTEEARTLEGGDVASSFMTPDPTFRMDAAAAEFAEILRGSYWAKDGNLAQAAGLARSASRQMGDPEPMREVVDLMERARGLWPVNEPGPWRDDPRFQDSDQ